MVFCPGPYPFKYCGHPGHRSHRFFSANTAFIRANEKIAGSYTIQTALI